MKKFKKFEIKNQKTIFGGKMKPTTWESSDGTGSGSDLYDSETGNFTYVPC